MLGQIYLFFGSDFQLYCKKYNQINQNLNAITRYLNSHQKNPNLLVFIDIFRLSDRND